MLNNLKFIRTALILLVTITFFSACQKEEVTPDTTKGTETANFFAMQNEQKGDDGNTVVIEEGSMDMDCFTFVYPIELVFPTGTTLTIENDEELETQVINWLDQNPNSDVFPTFNFPIQVTLEDGTTQSVGDEETLCLLVEECWDDEILIIDDSLEMEFPICVELVFPIEISLPDGTTQSANDLEEMSEILFTWYEANPNSDEEPSFVYPLTVVTDDGNQVVNSDEELEVLVEGCFEEFHDDCFELNYPVQIIFPDGIAVDVNSDEELETAVEGWYDENPTVDEDPTFAYPITVTLIDGTEQTINNDEELNELFETCYGDDCEVNGEQALLGGTKAILTKTVISAQ